MEGAFFDVDADTGIGFHFCCWHQYCEPGLRSQGSGQNISWLQSTIPVRVWAFGRLQFLNFYWIVIAFIGLLDCNTLRNLTQSFFDTSMNHCDVETCDIHR